MKLGFPWGIFLGPSPVLADLEISFSFAQAKEGAYVMTLASCRPPV